MLFRGVDQGMLAISQPAHAWVSGQLARAWGNKDFPAPEPWEEVCIASEQHDIGWNAWETAPTLNSETGLPHSFLELPLETHLAIWTEAPKVALSLGRYVALLVSLHGTLLYSRPIRPRNTPRDIAHVERYLEAQAALQASLLASLNADPYYAEHVRPERLRQNQRLIAAWDYISLLLCWGVTATRHVGEVPAAAGPTTISLSPKDGNVVVSPWPFRDGEVQLLLDARLIDRCFEDQASMRAYLTQAQWIRLSFRLIPG